MAAENSTSPKDPCTHENFFFTPSTKKVVPMCVDNIRFHYIFLGRLITWPWEITFVPLWIVLCISLVGVLYTIIFAGILLRMPEVNADQRRSSTNSALGKKHFWRSVQK